MASNSTPGKITTTSPCYARMPVEGVNSLRQMSLRGKLNIRGDASDSNFVDGIKRALGVELPVVANTLSEKESVRVYWLGPDEWLVHCDMDETSDLEARLATELSDLHHGVTEISDYYTVLRIRGPNTESILRKGCPLDLHHSQFRSGDIAQTRFGNASILLHKLGDGESWDIQVRWTYAEYLWDYLISGTRAL